MKRFIEKHLRRMVQTFFVFLIVWIGLEFYFFVEQLRSGGPVTITRPAGVEGFLPISALINLKYWLLTGDFTLIHPASLVLLLIFIAMAIVLKKGFCSWVCPIGLLSEYLAKIHTWIFDRPRRLPRWLDYPLRSLKYLLLAFFVYAVFFEMDQTTLYRFIYSPYNKVADIKMLLFFSQASAFTLRVIAVLLVLSVAVPYFWCRYLCPYGALLGVLSFISPFKIHRNKTTCIDCEKCTKVCPAGILVHKSSTVWSDECTGCLQCTRVCPVKDTLYFSVTERKYKLSRQQYALVLLLLFFTGAGMARLLNVWQNTISVQEYQHHIQHINEPIYLHNRGQVPESSNNAPGSYEK
jgi:polyferredoxin